MSTVPLEERLNALESKVDAAFAVDARLKGMEKQLEALNKPKTKTFADWLTALGPFASSVALLLIGYWVNDSVKAALAREQLDLDYVKDMRDVIKDFNQSAAQPEADANAIALALYGRHAFAPLASGLESFGRTSV